MQILLINFLMYLGFSLYIFKKYHRITIYHLVWLLFTVIAFMGYYSYLIGAYSTIFKDDGKFVIEPYIYCFISVFLLLLPLKKFQKNYSIESYKELDGGKLNFLANFLCVISGLRFLAVFVMFASIIATTGLGAAYENYHFGGNEVLGLSEWQSKIIWLTQPFQSNFFWFAPLVALMALNNRDRISKKWIFITTMIITSEILGYLSRSARGELMYLCIKVGLLLALVWPYLRSSIKKKVVSLGLLFAGFLFVYAIYITIDRFQDSDLDTQDGIIRYLGEPFPNLGNQVWNHVLHYPMGVRFFPFLFGFDDTADSVAGYQEFWELYIGIPMLNFRTVYGDFYVEFGKIGGLIGVIIVSVIWMIVLRSKNLKLYMIPMLTVYLHTITMAPLYFIYRGTSMYVQVLLAIIFTILIKWLMYKPQVK
jgi:oligosaccharide repeat unit polymerase